jgi:hypothetical protein
MSVLVACRIFHMQFTGRFIIIYAISIQNFIFPAPMAHYLSLLNWRLNKNFAPPPCCFRFCKRIALAKLRMFLKIITALHFMPYIMCCCYWGTKLGGVTSSGIKFNLVLWAYANIPQPTSPYDATQFNTYCFQVMLMVEAGFDLHSQHIKAWCDERHLTVFVSFCGEEPRIPEGSIAELVSVNIMTFWCSVRPLCKEYRVRQRNRRL